MIIIYNVEIINNQNSYFILKILILLLYFVFELTILASKLKNFNSVHTYSVVKYTQQVSTCILDSLKHPIHFHINLNLTNAS